MVLVLCNKDQLSNRMVPEAFITPCHCVTKVYGNYSLLKVMSKYIEAYGTVNLKYPSKAIQRSQKAQCILLHSAAGSSSVVATDDHTSSIWPTITTTLATPTLKVSTNSGVCTSGISVHIICV